MGKFWKGTATILNFLYSVCLFICLSINCYAKGYGQNVPVNYIDSLRHNNIVYSDNEANNLMRVYQN